MIYADDMVCEFDKVCAWRRKLKVNVAKSKIVVVSRSEGHRVNIQLQGEKMEQVRIL